MKSTQQYKIGKIKQLIYLNEKRTTSNFTLDFEITSIDSKPFQMIIVEQDTLDTLTDIEYKTVPVSVNGKIVSPTLKFYVLIIKSDDICTIEVSTHIYDNQTPDINQQNINQQDMNQQDMNQQYINQPYNPQNMNQPYNPQDMNQPYNPQHMNQPYNPQNMNQPYNPQNMNQPYNPQNMNPQDMNSQNMNQVLDTPVITKINWLKIGIILTILLLGCFLLWYVYKKPVNSIKSSDTTQVATVKIVQPVIKMKDSMANKLMEYANKSDDFNNYAT